MVQSPVNTYRTAMRYKEKILILLLYTIPLTHRFWHKISYIDRKKSDLIEKIVDVIETSKSYKYYVNSNNNRKCIDSQWESPLNQGELHWNAYCICHRQYNDKSKNPKKEVTRTMKKNQILLLLAVLLFVALPLMASNNIENATVKNFDVLESTSTSTTLHFNLPEFKVATQELNGMTFNKIETECDGFVPELGKPELPLYSTMVAIPYSGSVSLEVVNKTSYQIDNFTAVPAQDYTVENEMERSFAINEDFYNSNVDYPEVAERVSEPMIFRDFRIVTLTFSPFTYNASTRSLTVNEDVTYRLHYNDTPGANEMEAPTMYSPSFQPIYRDLIANYDLVMDRNIPTHNMRLLIVHGGSNDASFNAKLDEYVKWKKQKGYKVTIQSTDVIGSSTNDVKAYIQSKYNNIYTRPEYVNLIGDVGGAFDISCYTVHGGASDYPYTYLAGDDIMGDVFIGRMPIENVDDFLTMANKVFIFERDPIPVPPTWYNHMLLVGYTNSAGQSSMYVNKFMKDSGLKINPDYTFTELYGTPSSTTMQQTINQGAAFFMYRGWIGMNGWDTPSESEFNNGNKMTHCIINTCSTGNFNSSDATDKIVRYGSPAAPKGAITAIGMATSGTHTLMNNVLSSQTVNGIFSLGYRNMSAPLLSSKILLYMVYHDFIADYAEKFPGWCNLMGDPTVEVWVSPPDALNAEYPTEVFPGQTCYPVYVEDASGNPIEGAIVTIVNDSMHLIMETDENGNAVFELPNDLTENTTFTVTASQHDYIPQYEDVTVHGANGIHVASFEILDADGGNGDGTPDASETFLLNVTLTNPGDTEINAANVEISANDPYINIMQNTSAYGTIAPGASVTNATPYEMHIYGSTPQEYMASLKLEVIGEDYETFLGLDVRNGNMDVASYQIYDDNGILEPGETAWMSLSLVNNGDHMIEGLHAELSSTSNLVFFDDNEAYYGYATPGTVITNITDGLYVTARSQLLTGTDIVIDLYLYNDDGYEEYDKLYISTGSQGLGHPSGPDAFGHYIYHMDDTDWADAPTYNWIEIAPSEGGPGTEFTGHSDTGTDGGDGDITMSDTIDNTNLPFTFTWYGVDYDEVYICTNGFFSFAPTEVGTFRNYPIPGTMTPQPVIAPFWDDMFYTGNQGVFHYYDTTNNYFIIEWWGTNGFTGSHQERFQVILYDPAYYPTSNGDGMVKIQYHTHNDVDTGDTSAYPPRAGQYSTVGFCDHHGVDGLQYVFDQDYISTGQPISDGTALLITGEPYINAEPNLELDGLTIEEANGNGYVEPGESIEIFASIMNSGIDEAEDVVATISSTDPNIAFIIDTTNYEEIPGSDGVAVNPTPFTAMISPTATEGLEIPVNIMLATQDDSWQIDGTITVASPQIGLTSAMLCDFEAGNSNGIADQDENVTLVLNLHNPSLADIDNVQVNVSTTNPNVAVNGETTLAMIPAEGNMQALWGLNILTAVPTGTTIDFEVEIQSASSVTTNETVSVIVGQSSLQACGVIVGTVSVDTGDVNLEDIYVTAGDYARFALADGEFRVYPPIGMYEVEASLEYYASGIMADVAISNGSEVATGVSLDLEYLAPATGLDGSWDDWDYTLTWTAPASDQSIDHYAIYRSHNEGEYMLVGTSDNEEYEDELEEHGLYNYFVVVEYDAGYSENSNEHIFNTATDLEEDVNTPHVTALYGNYPNPFNPVTNISFSLAKDQNVKINIYNIRGQLVRNLTNEVHKAGRNTIQWDGMDNDNKGCSTGLYMYRFETKGMNTVKKAMLLK